MAASAALAISLFALLMPATATAGPGLSTSTLADGGVLRLALGTTDALSLHLPDGLGGYASASKTQSISNGQGCKLALSGDPLVRFAPPNGNTPSPYTGFVSDAIGVGSNGEGAGQPCGRLDPGQTLTLNLDTGLDGKLIDFAEIDVELKFGATLRVTGNLVKGTTVTPAGSADYSSTGSDSGPDSADGDNYRIRFPRTGTTAVNQLVFSIVGTTGGVSLEGGADGTGACDLADGCTEPSLGQSLSTTDSVFHLVDADGTLACGDTATQGGTGGTPLNSLERLNNTTAGCVPIPYNLESSITDCELTFNQCVLLQKDLLGQNAQFFWTVTWAPEDGEYMESETEFDFGFGFQKLQMCLADDNDADTYPELPPKAATSPAGSPDPDPWCVVTTSTQLIVTGANAGKVIVTEKYFGSGDPGGSRH
ncbi:MAG TPA: hypothetical protein VFP13_08985 [Actinomycetota bacterium]|nr:hypothetical protein [Actinomycetota bacterium]